MVWRNCIAGTKIGEDEEHLFHRNYCIPYFLNNFVLAASHHPISHQLRSSSIYHNYFPDGKCAAPIALPEFQSKITLHITVNQISSPNPLSPPHAQRTLARFQHNTELTEKTLTFIIIIIICNTNIYISITSSSSLFHPSYELNCSVTMPSSRLRGTIWAIDSNCCSPSSAPSKFFTMPASTDIVWWMPSSGDFRYRLLTLMPARARCFFLNSRNRHFHHPGKPERVCVWSYLDYLLSNILFYTKNFFSFITFVAASAIFPFHDSFFSFFLFLFEWVAILNLAFISATLDV